MEIMKIYRYIASAAILAALVSCEKNTAPQALQEGNTIDLSVSAVFPELTADGLTKVTFQGTDLVWEGTESIGVIIGDDASKTGDASTYQTSELKATSIPGVFAGTVDLGKFTKENIHGIVCPFDPDNSWWRNNNGSHRIVMNIAKQPQVQKSNNVLNGAYAPLFAELSYDKITDSQLGNTVEGLQLKWGCALIRFNIYGAMPETKGDEVFKSIDIQMGNGLGTCEYQVEDGNFNFNAGSGTLNVSLEESCTIADKTSANGVKVFATFSPRTEKGDTLVAVKKIVIHTNKADYTKTFTSKNVSLLAGKVLQVGLDLSTFDSRTSTVTTEEIYSIDGGTTWTDTCPTSSDTFTSLTVKGLNLTAGDLESFKTLIASQSAPVALDLSGCQYESTVWPLSVFKASSSAPNIKLKSIKFPANVNEIEAQLSGNDGAFSYCNALESVDLSGIKTIGNCAFANSGLKSVNIPNTCTSIANQAFRWCFSLADVYYNSPAAAGSNMFSISDTDATNDNNPNNIARTLTIGPDVTSIPGNCFRSTPMLKTVIFESSPSLGTNVFNNDKHISTIICKSSTPPTGASFTNASTGASETNKQLIVPKGSKSAYEASPWANELVGRGYVITEAAE